MSEPGRLLPKRASSHLDMIRASAALLVFLGHLRAMFFIDAASATGMGIFGKLVYYMTGLGHQSVMIFFVLSGFLVGGSILRSEAINQWSWKNYISQRAVRLYVVLIPALLLTLLWDTVGIKEFGLTENFYGGWLRGAAFTSINIKESLTPLAFFGNLAFLETILVPCFGTNSPLWSLANEAWYYALCPLCFAVFSSRNNWIKRILMAAAVIGIFFFLPRDISAGFLIWLLGLAVAYFMKKDWKLFRNHWSVRALAGFIFLSSIHFSRMNQVPDYLNSDLIVGLTFALFLWTIVSIKNNPPTSPIYFQSASLLSNMSFTLYVTHFPVIVYAQTALLKQERWSPTPENFGSALLLASGIFFYSFIISRFTEAKTTAIRSFLAKKIAILSTRNKAEGSVLH